MLDEPDGDWLGIETVISWNPITDRAEVIGDPQPQLVGHISDEANQLHASPRAFFQAWAMRRAQFLSLRQTTSAHWSKPPAERDEAPGGLIVGDPHSIRWNASALPASIDCVGIDPQVINRAILRAAHLPRATASSHLRSAA